MDVSENTKLESLDCTDVPLSELDLSQNLLLTDLFIERMPNVTYPANWTGWHMIGMGEDASGLSAYFAEPGVPTIGWRYIQDDSYDAWFYFDSYGVAVRGWHEIDGNWYFFEYNGLKKFSTGWIQYHADWYYAN